MAYCGCGTKANKGRWAMVVLLLALAVIFLVVNIIVGRDCKVCKDETNNGVTTRTCSGDPDFGDNDWDDIEGCSEGAVVSTFVLFIVCAVAATVPCCCMCCCATPPKKPHEYAVAVVSKPQEQQQAAYYANQQTYGQPVQPQPAYAPDGYGHVQPQVQPEMQPPRVHDVNSPAVV